MSEYIDVYDANLAHIGVDERLAAHRSGKWHKTFHCWIVTSELGGALLFQRRSATMKNFPGLLDVSAAGHLEAGETIEDGIREVVEELGIPILMDHLKFAGYRVEVADQENGQLNREYQAVFLGIVNHSLMQYRPQKEEVSALLWMPIADGMRFFAGEILEIKLQGIEIGAGGTVKEINVVVSIQNFLPRIQRYYLAALINAERALAGSHYLAIS